MVWVKELVSTEMGRGRKEEVCRVSGLRVGMLSQKYLS